MARTKKIPDSSYEWRQIQCQKCGRSLRLKFILGTGVVVKTERPGDTTTHCSECLSKKVTLKCSRCGKEYEYGAIAAESVHLRRLCFGCLQLSGIELGFRPRGTGVTT